MLGGAGVLALCVVLFQLECAPGSHQVLTYGDMRSRALDFYTFKHLAPVVI